MHVFCLFLSFVEHVYKLNVNRHQWHRGPNAGGYVDKVCEQIYNVSGPGCEINFHNEVLQRVGDYGYNFAKVTIYFQELTHEHVEEKPLYEESQMLADIGGSLGLFIGASVLSFGEVIEVIFECVHALLRGRKRQLETGIH